MKTNIVNLRYNMKEVIKALDRREKVSVFYHGKLKGTIIPADHPKEEKIEEHPFVGMLKDSKESVQEVMDKIRKPRYDDI